MVGKGQYRFAVLGGGLSPSRGSSNVDNGITVDLQRLSLVEVGLDSHQVQIGGGVTFLANSSIVRASESQNQDLYWALRGGRSNIGIVTSVIVETFVQPAHLYVFRRWNGDALHSVFTRLDYLSRAMPADVQMFVITFAWSPQHQEFVVSECIVSSQPSQSYRTTRTEEKQKTQMSQERPLRNDRPFILEEQSYIRISLQMAQVIDYSSEEGYFNSFGSVTIKSDTSLYRRIAEIFKQQMLAVLDIAGVQAYIVYNPLTVETMRHMQKRGGNALGLKEDHPLIIVSVNMCWRYAADTQRTSTFTQTLLNRFSSAADSMGNNHPCVILNHCFETQRPLPSYEHKSLKRLHQIREAVVPHGLFQLLQEAHYRLGVGLDEHKDPGRTVK